MHNFDVRTAILHTINERPAISSEEIVRLTALPPFAVRDAVSYLHKKRLIERTGKAMGIGRYCISGKRDDIILERLSRATTLSIRGENIGAIELLIEIRQGFLLVAESESRCDALLQFCVLNELQVLFVRKKVYPVRLQCMAEQLCQSWQKTRILIKPLIRRGILKKSSSTFIFSYDAILP